MSSVIKIYKPIGLTPLQLIYKLQQHNPLLASRRIGYAGRLDPMADGLMLFLVDEENKKHKAYERLSKEYLFTILLGMTTDTYDILGMITHASLKLPSLPDAVVQSSLQTFVGTIDQPYPPYSSARVLGKPLFYFARKGKLQTITIPKKQIRISKLVLVEQKRISATDLKKLISKRIGLVSGDFRQKEIVKKWNEFFQNTLHPFFPTITAQVSCSSGTYVRSLANDLGKTFGSGGLSLQITRTRIGKYQLEDALRI